MDVGEEGANDVLNIRLAANGESPYVMSVSINQNNIVLVTRICYKLVMSRHPNALIEKGNKLGFLKKQKAV